MAPKKAGAGRGHGAEPKQAGKRGQGQKRGSDDDHQEPGDDGSNQSDLVVKRVRINGKGKGSNQESDDNQLPKADAAPGEPRTPERVVVSRSAASPLPKMRASPSMFGMTASPKPAVASPKAKKLAASASKAKNKRGGVLTTQEQHSFQAWLSRQKTQGTSKAAEWNINHKNESWRHTFHEQWKTARDNTKNEVLQVSSQKSAVITGGADDWYTIHEFAKLENIPVDSDLCKTLFSSLTSRPNRNAAFADIEEMNEGHYVKASKKKWEEANSTETASRSLTGLDAAEGEELDRILSERANAEATPTKKVGKTVKLKTLETETKRLKMIHKCLIGERVLSEGYLARLDASDKEWAESWHRRLNRAMQDLTASTHALVLEMNRQMTFDERSELCRDYDEQLRNYRKGVVAQVCAMLSGPA